MMEQEENLHPDAKGIFVVFQSGPPATPTTPETPAISQPPQEVLEAGNGERSAGAASVTHTILPVGSSWG